MQTMALMMTGKFGRNAIAVLVMAFAFLLVPVVFAPSVHALLPSSNGTSGASCSASKTFLGLHAWYEFLDLAPDPDSGQCEVNFPSDSQAAFGGHSPFLLIGLAVVDDLLRIATLVAVGYVIYGGFRYMTSQGSPEGTKGAQGTIINALIGLVIAVLASAIVSYLGHSLSVS